ncbi:SMI1/KNR4 family protein [Streptomyces sp. NPDC045431]|uniref:SMI1/KNR4 family protein n=1 Tax=Streptomyces sp. NPDC045431 TaxID=3155613 RepID=UPI0033C8A3D0
MSVGSAMMRGTSEGTGADMVEQAVRALVEAIVAEAPSGWAHAVMHGRIDRGDVTVTGGYTPRENPWDSRMPHPLVELMMLGEALRQERGWESVSVEVRCLPTGAYRFAAFDDSLTWVTGEGSGYQLVLDPDYRLPQPGAHQDPGTAAPAGDPELAVARFRTYLERRAAILGHAEELPPPATAAELDEAERRLGRRLPADLRALYAVADGDGDLGLFRGHAWVPLRRLVAESTGPYAVERPWFGWDLEWDGVVFDTTPADTVRRCGAHPGWLRFTTAYDGNYLAVDTVPARDGRPGQVIHTGRDYDRGPSYVADSVTSLLGHYLDLLEQGAYEQRGDRIALLGTGRESAPRDIVGGMPDEVPPSLQALHINDAPDVVDLAPLTAAPRLRRLHLNRSTTGDLTPVRDLPVESLRVTLVDGDLAPLAGHAHLTSLGLTTTAPTDLTPLRTVPHLRGLDLSGADTPDLTALAGLPELRYLALTGRQWAALLDAGAVPPALAAAQLADRDATLDDALAWAARLGLDTANALHSAGTHDSLDLK